MSGRVRALVLYGGLTAAAVVIDQLVKRAVESSMALYEQIDLLPFLALFHTRNTGIAFSMLSGVGGAGLALVSVAVTGVVLALAALTKPGQVFARCGFALIVGGAIGNLIDRALNGYVTDYILFHTPVWSFAVFNLADAFITVGAGLVILEELLAWLRERRATRTGAGD